jgi:hypothetical protein
MNDETKNNVPAVDGFDDDWAQDDFVRVIQGEKWSFTNEGTWVNADEQEIPRNREVVVVDIARVLQKWIDKTPVETRFLASGEHVDIDQLNDACPKSEFREDLNGRLKGPWQVQHVVYMVDMETMQKFTYPTSTTGGTIAIGDVKDAVRSMRRFKGPGIYPVVSPATKHMNTRFGGRQRPHFVIKRWISFGPDGTALPAAPTAALPLSGAHAVAEPTLREEMDDSIPF